MKKLSGGEKSYTTVAILLALAGETNSPVMALDEWDVFMDEANRHVALKAVLTYAADHQWRQFLLLTPLDVSNLETHKRKLQADGKAIDVNVLRLPPAR